MTETLKVKDFVLKLSDKISELYLSPELKDHPAIADYTLELSKQIVQSIGNFIDLVEVKEGNNQYKIQWIAENGSNNAIIISSRNPYVINYLMMGHFIGDDMPDLNRKTVLKNVVEVKGTFYQDGTLQINRNVSFATNTNKDSNKVDNTTTASKIVYDEDGIMISQEDRMYIIKGYNIPMEQADPTTLLRVSRESMTTGSPEEYAQRVLIERESIDLAKILYEDTISDKRYRGVIELSSNSYRKLEPACGDVSNLPSQVTIAPLNKEEIEEKLNKESSLVFREGLKKYTSNRETYFYSSIVDPYFVCELNYESKRIL